MMIPPQLVLIAFGLFGLILTFAVPVSRLRGHHFALNLVIFLCFALAGLAAAIMNWRPGLWVGPLVGIVAILGRDIARWIAHFRWEAYRYTHPYYYYNLIARHLVRDVVGSPQRRRKRR